MKKLTRLFTSSVFIAFVFSLCLSSCKDPYQEGREMMSKGDYEGASKFYKEQLDKKPNEAFLYNEYGVTLKKLGRPSNAKAMYMKAIELNPDYIEARYNLGTVYMELHDPVPALKEFDIVIKNRPSDPKVLNQRGVALFYISSYDEAISEIEKAIDLDPNPVYKDNLARVKKEKEFRAKMDEKFLEK